MLNKRQENILIIMHNNKGWIIGKELAKMLGVSDRTIRSDIVNINKAYNKKLIESNIKFGYKIDENSFQMLDIKQNEIIPQTPEERCIYIIKELLFEHNEINLTFLQDKVFVSGYSIDNDIKKIKNMIEPYGGLQIVRSKNYIYLKGKEGQKRRLYKDLLENEIKGNFLNLNKIASFYNDFDLIQVKDILEDTLKEYHYHICELNFTILIMHIGIAIERIIRHNFVKTDRGTEKLKQSLEYKIAKTFFEKLKWNLRIEVVDDEIVLLTLLLLGKNSEAYTDNDSKCQFDYDISDLLKEIIDDIKKVFDVDFSHDNELKKGLELHIISLIQSHEKDIKNHNMYLDEIKRNYPLIFEMGVRVSKVLEEKIHIHIEEDEISFIALHLGAAYARINSKYKYRAVMIYPRNKALSDLCLQKIINRFGDRMSIINCMSFFEKASIINLKPDLILTTLPLKHDLHILTIQISLFINYKDESNIFQALNKLDRIKCQGDFENLVLKLITKEFFYVHVNENSPAKLITKMCDGLYKKGYVEEPFKNSVIQREKISATSFDYGFAVPHSINETFVNRSALSIAILDKPIQWGDFDVRLVILFAISKEDHKVLRIFFDWLSNVVSNSEQFVKLLEVEDYKEFIDKVLK